MNNIFNSNVGGTPPDMTGGVQGYPQDGDPTTSRAATRPGARWFWAVTKEILNVIAAGSIAPDAATLNQMANAIQTIANNAAAAAQAAAISAATTLASAAQAAAQSTVLGWFTGSNQLYAANGYQVLPGGGIHNWTSTGVTAIADAEVTVTYSKPFTSFSAIPVPTVVDPARAGDESNFLGLSVVSYNLSGCVIAMGQNGGGARNVTLGVSVYGK